MTPETYIPDALYHALIDSLLTPAATLDPRGRIVELLGDLAGVWPESARPTETA